MSVLELENERIARKLIAKNSGETTVINSSSAAVSKEKSPPSTQKSLKSLLLKSKNFSLKNLKIAMSDTTHNTH